MNAYNNITWESDRLEYEEGHSPYGNKGLMLLGIPSAPRKGESFSVNLQYMTLTHGNSSGTAGLISGDARIQRQ